MLVSLKAKNKTSLSWKFLLKTLHELTSTCIFTAMDCLEFLDSLSF